ncbi:hypothetical protein F4802DRAFT_550911 [Xylaria palmicola]|nr:hypothetical protein F4802DRAFT_550911 [Xylaria palmicola]
MVRLAGAAVPLGIVRRGGSLLTVVSKQTDKRSLSHSLGSRERSGEDRLMHAHKRPRATTIRLAAAAFHFVLQCGARVCCPEGGRRTASTPSRPVSSLDQSAQFVPSSESHVPRVPCVRRMGKVCLLVESGASLCTRLTLPVPSAIARPDRLLEACRTTLVLSFSPMFFVPKTSRCYAARAEGGGALPAVVLHRSSLEGINGASWLGCHLHVAAWAVSWYWDLPDVHPDMTSSRDPSVVQSDQRSSWPGGFLRTWEPLASQRLCLLQTDR